MSTVWLITGAASGFGRELGKAVLQKGYHAVLTDIDTAPIQDYAADYPGRSIIRKVDVTVPAHIADVVGEVEKTYGKIDGLACCVGHGHLGTVEETPEADIRTLFDVNFLGTVRLIQAVLPGMRQRRSGSIITFSSTAGLAAFPGAGFYSATKFALEGFTEALAQEVQGLGLKVMIVEPGPFRTNWQGKDFRTVQQNIADYAETAWLRQKQITDLDKQQPGDPARAATIILDTIESGNAPLRLLLGKKAIAVAHQKLEKMRQEFMQWETASRGADFPDDQIF